MNAGDRIGSWTVVSDKITRVRTDRYVLCECYCGERSQVRVANLESGKSLNCKACSQNAPRLLAEMRAEIRARTQ